MGSITNLQIVLNTSKNRYFKTTQKNTCQNFPTEKKDPLIILSLKKFSSHAEKIFHSFGALIQLLKTNLYLWVATECPLIVITELFCTSMLDAVSIWI